MATFDNWFEKYGTRNVPYIGFQIWQCMSTRTQSYVIEALPDLKTFGNWLLDNPCEYKYIQTEYKLKFGDKLNWWVYTSALDNREMDNQEKSDYAKSALTTANEIREWQKNIVTVLDQLVLKALRANQADIAKDLLTEADKYRIKG